MEINRNNYEAWFLDYAEGNLSAEQVADLLLFVEEHPDLKEEFEEDFGDIVLEPETISFDLKDSLKREGESSLITAENVEDYIISNLEGLLDAPEKQALAAFLKANPQFQADRALYAKVYLEADTSIQYPHKARLKKRAAIVPLFVRYAAAAAVAIFLMVFGWTTWKEDPTSVEVAGVTNENPTTTEETPRDFIPYTELAKADAPEEEELVPETNEDEATQVVEVAEKEVAPTQPKLKENITTPEPKVVEKPSVQMAEEKPEPKSSPEEKEIDEPNQQEDKVVTIAAADKPEETKPLEKKVTAKKTAQKPLTVAEYAGRRVKKDVLKKEQIRDGRLRENDLANGVAMGMGAMSKKDVRFKDRSNDKSMSYTVSIGGFGFSRTKSKK